MKYIVNRVYSLLNPATDRPHIITLLELRKTEKAKKGGRGERWDMKCKWETGRGEIGKGNDDANGIHSQ